MMEPLSIHAVKEIITSISQSAEHCKLSQQEQKTERARIETQKKVFLDALQNQHEKSMSIIQCSFQERMELIRIAGDVVRKETLNDQDAAVCQALLAALSSSQTASVQALEAAAQILPEQNAIPPASQLPVTPKIPRLPK